MRNDYETQIPWKDWKITRRLGGGGFGTVYEIERDFYGEKEYAAMKVIRIPKEESDLEDDYNSGMTEEEVQEKYTYIQKYFSKEYQLMLEFKGHSNIVNCHDFSVVQNADGPGCTLYIRMEFLTPLKEVLKKESFSEQRIVQLGMDICRALEICEQRDVIHRDVKPDNIMMSEFGNFKLGDFGIARTMEKTMSASMTGTDWYMAPEVAKKMKYGKSVDTYSLGLVLYWLLNDYRLPFVPEKDRITAKDMQEAYRLRMKGEPIPEPKGGSRELKKIVLKALAFDREKRYHTGKEMLEALQKIEKSVQGEVKKEVRERKTENKRESSKKQSTEMKSKEVKNKETENVWRTAYAEKILKKSKEYEYAGVTLPQDSVLGIYLDTEVLHVRCWINGRIRPVISIPAYYVLNELDETLTGSQAVVHAKIRKDVSLHSVLAFMQETNNNMMLEDAGVKRCITLMKELKRNLEKIVCGTIPECVLTISVPEIVIQKNVQTAMEQAGFRVLRVMSVVEACALAKAYPMSEEQQMLVRVLANHERQNLTADYTGDILESLEYTFGERLPDTITSDMAQYCLSDAISRKDLGREADQYEELAVAAADGAVLQGIKLTRVLAKSILLLPLFPWKVGIEIVTDQNEKALPLTWISKEPEIIPTRGKERLSVPLNSGIQKKRLRLYLEAGYSKKLIREWNLEEVCKGFPKDIRLLEVQMEIDCETTSLKLVICAEKKAVKVGLNQYENEKIDRIPLETTYVPETILRNVQYASQEFCRKADEINKDSAIGRGIQMIVRQAEEVFVENTLEGREVRVNTFIEKMLTVKDNIEYGLTGAHKTTECEEYLDEKLLLTYFRKALADNLYRLNVEPIEANGNPFDPYIHEAMHIEETDAVEENIVVSEIQKGYFLGDKLYRPAKVVVSKWKGRTEDIQESWGAYSGETVGRKW